MLVSTPYTPPPCGSIYIGCAGWSLPREHRGLFPEGGTHLAQYARRFGAVEINSSFYRAHRPQTYARWAASVPADFRFAVKVIREITHQRRLVDPVDPLDRFLTEVRGLGEKLGPLLVQLPPSLAFDTTVASAFFTALRQRYEGSVVCEPRHPGWFGLEAEAVLSTFDITRVIADPPPVPEATSRGGEGRVVYYRLHGSPRMYYSEYSDAYLATLAAEMRQAAATAAVWCIFDNTAQGAATINALDVIERLQKL